MSEIAVSAKEVGLTDAPVGGVADSQGKMAAVELGNISVANTTGGTASEQAIKAAQDSKDQLMMIYEVVSTKTQDFLAERKPTNEFFDRTALDKPASMGEAWSRIRRNALYFRVNYAIIIVSTMALSLLLNPLAALLIAGLACGWGYICMFRTDPVIIGGHTLSDREKMIGCAAISALCVFVFSGVGYLLFTSLAIGAALCAVHGSLRVPYENFDTGLETTFLPKMGTMSVASTVIQV